MRASRPTFRQSRFAGFHGRHVSLVPLRRADAAELARVPDDPAWDLLIRKPAIAGTDPGWLADALRGTRSGRERCWLIRDRLDGRLLGSTRYLNIELHNRRLEIGATWLLPEARRSSANAESKLLLLDHAFDQLGIDRVHIQADVRNARSRRAIEALGASFEGVLRRHLVLPDGSSRDTAVYSILVDEWPSLRPGVVERIASRGPAWRSTASSLVPEGVLPASPPRPGGLACPA